MLFFIRSDVLCEGHATSLNISIIVTAEQKLVMLDFIQSTVKMSSLERPDVLEDTLANGLRNMWYLVQLSNGTIAVTARWSREIHLIKVNGSKLELVRKINTEKYYSAVADFADSNLIATSSSNGNMDASIDIITRSGEVLQTIVSGEDYPNLNGPYGLTLS